jgi:hypothetical protein
VAANVAATPILAKIINQNVQIASLVIAEYRVHLSIFITSTHSAELYLIVKNSKKEDTMYFVDPHAEMCLYRIEQARLTRRLELLRALNTGNTNSNAVASLVRSLASAIRRVRGGSDRVAPVPTPITQHREGTAARHDGLAA